MAMTLQDHSTALEVPERFGRYRVEEVIAQGNFGLVLRGRDEELHRPVAIKTLNPRVLDSPGVVELFLKEGRTLACLDHPGILPIYDVGRTEDGLCFLVTRLVGGNDLKDRLEKFRLSPAESAGIVIQVAEALHHAHEKGLVHRDVKPSNILIENDRRAIVADFGLAFHAADFGQGPEFVGTLTYMSPEQARRESHRVDPRTDIYSLGVVFYEMLTGRLPYEATTRDQLIECVRNQEIRPLRLVQPDTPRELERICLKMLAKRITDRYATAQDLIQDLRAWQRGLAPESVSQSVRRVVPRGLQPFGCDDADFFLSLLPGPRDRDGLPESIAFWKRHLEAVDQEAFSVGLLYGPSGCGKTSFVQAGLLPRLDTHVLAIHVDASPNKTEEDLLKKLRRRLPNLPADLDLIRSLRLLRSQPELTRGGKVVLILDQFEQWLHSHNPDEPSPLLEALRQCDGEHLQCLLAVRDDFWLAVSRFLHQLEVPLREGQNCALVDLFDTAHARNVLTRYGQAFELLPESLSQEQEAFIRQSIAELSQEGKIIPIRLSVFAEMVRNKEWTPATLAALGGAKGTGVAFLEEALAARTAPAARRVHADALRSILRGMTPDSDSLLKSRRLSLRRLRELSQYQDRPNDFAQVLHILVGELRLITPVQSDDSTNVHEESGEDAEFQLTHDYLVPAIRDWLDRKDRETRAGRANMQLAEFTSLWESHPVNGSLPSALEWLEIRRFTNRSLWNDDQRRMMSAATRRHRHRAMVALMIFLGILGGMLGVHFFMSNYIQNRAADTLVSLIQNSDYTQAVVMTEEMRRLRPYVEPRLFKLQKDPEAQDSTRLYATIFLFGLDAIPVLETRRVFLEGKPDDVLVLREFLKSADAPLLWSWFNEKPQLSKRARLNLADALAKIDPGSDEWSREGATIIQLVLTGDTIVFGDDLDALRPVRRQMVPHLIEAFHDQGHPQQQSLAADALRDYLGDRPRQLTELLLDGSNAQFSRLFPALAAHPTEAFEVLDRALAMPLPAHPSEKELGRKARAAGALWGLGRQYRVLPLLGSASDPRLRSYLIEQFHTWEIDLISLLNAWRAEADPIAKRALLLSMSYCHQCTLSAGDRASWDQQLFDSFRRNPDAADHAALRWLLGRWGLADKLAEAERELAGKPQDDRQWFVGVNHTTFNTVRGPVRFDVEVPDTLTKWKRVEKRIEGSFAMSWQEVSIEQYRRFQKDFDKEGNPADVAIGMTWVDAAKYCRWLCEQDGIPDDQMPYPPMDKIHAKMNLPADFHKRAGYRLPTDLEWQYCCRGNHESRLNFRTLDQLLNFSAASRSPGGPNHWPRPNDLGFFDMNGNAWEWCHVAGEQDEVGLMGIAFAAPNSRTSVRVCGPAINDVSVEFLQGMKAYSGFRVVRVMK